MPKPSCSDEEFMKLFSEHGAQQLALILGMTERRVYSRRRAVEERQGAYIAAPNAFQWTCSYPKRVPIDIKDGIVIVGSDAHYWPDVVSTAHRGFVKLVKEIKPKHIILNGDVFDGARISRHPALGWESKPTVRQERDAVEERLTEIEDACRNSTRHWTIGNHCARFEARLAQNASEFEEMNGFSLKDHFPKWDMAISLWLNKDVVIKHRYKGGVHATHNNTLNAGKTIVTGHLHSLKVTPFDDYNGTRWGVDTGTLAQPDGPQFSYAEDNPMNHRSGFIIMTFHRGRLLWPEIVNVIDQDHIGFRGQVIKV